MPGSANEFGLTVANALNVSANNHQISVEELFGQLRSLIGEMERDVMAQSGTALHQFQLAKADFVTAYNALADKYGVSAMAQGQTNTDGVNIDGQNEGEYAGAHGAMTPIKPVTITV
ncbi:hypothetical protein [Glycomyces tenuis]|uniref:hypothetical protein n=1 Tax=Glycomyces tenuis TaxID=58116 RepID=UPI000404377C|nr:hypothetical protein [Glycomyces tenuis]